MKNEELKQIKNLIKKAIGLVGASGARITLSNADDCSLFVSNLFGYRNWQAVRDFSREQDKKYEELGGFNIFSQKKINSIKPIDFEQVDLKLRKQTHTRFKKEIFPKKTIYREAFDFAYTEDEYLKTLNVVEFRTQHSVVVSSIGNDAFLNLVENELKKSQSSYVTFVDKKEVNVDFDPWLTMLRTNQLETYFFKKQDAYSPIFIQMLRDLQNINVALDLQEVIDWFEMPKMLSLMAYMKEKNLPSYQLFNAFMRNIGIKITQGIHISEDLQKRYWEAVSFVYDTLNQLQERYTKGIFKKLYGEDVLLDSIEQRKDIKISKELLLDNFSLEVLKLELERVFAIYEDSFETSEDQYTYWFLIDDIHLFEDFSWSWLYKFKFINTLFLAEKVSEMINEYILNSTQVLIGKNLSADFSSEVKELWLNCVISWPTYFWKDGCAILNLLRDGEYYLISPKMISSGELDFKDYYCKKISLIDGDLLD